MVDLLLTLTIIFGVITIIALYIGLKSYVNARKITKQLGYIEEKIILPDSIEKLKEEKSTLEKEIAKKEYAKLILGLIEIDELIARKSNEREKIMLKLPSLEYLQNSSKTYRKYRKQLETKKKELYWYNIIAVIIGIISAIITVLLSFWWE